MPDCLKVYKLIPIGTRSYSTEYAPHISGDSPEPTRAALMRLLTPKSFELLSQQHFLALNTCEILLYLLRPWFARAIKASPEDPGSSRYGEAFRTVLVRCKVSLRCQVCLHHLEFLTTFPTSASQPLYLAFKTYTRF